MNSSLVSATSLPSMHDEENLATNFRAIGGKSSVKMTKKQVDIFLLGLTQTLLSSTHTSYTLTHTLSLFVFIRIGYCINYIRKRNSKQGH